MAISVYILRTQKMVVELWLVCIYNVFNLKQNFEYHLWLKNLYLSDHISSNTCRIMFGKWWLSKCFSFSVSPQTLILIEYKRQEMSDGIKWGGGSNASFIFKFEVACLCDCKRG